MKKLFYMLIIFTLLGIKTTCFASDGEYIFRVKEPEMMLFSSDENISYLGDGLYTAKNPESIYNFTDEDNILTVFPDYQLELSDADFPEVTSDAFFSYQWNLEMISSVVAREKGIFGNDVKVAVIDSGLDTGHPDFKADNILQGYNCLANASDVTDVSDNVGHGTMVCGIIAAQSDNQTHISGIAPGVKIIPLKVAEQTSFSMSRIHSAIQKAIELDCDIINMSLGGALTDERAINELKRWVDAADDAGIIMVASVGNGGTSLHYPAAFENVIGVGSVDKNKNISASSQQNESVFVTAPGDRVPTLYPSKGAVYGTGTSFAAPHVTAAIALIKQLWPECSISEIKELLKNTVTDLGDEGYDTCFGYGLLNIEKILENLSEYIPDFVISRGKKDETARIHIHNNSGKAITADGFFAGYQDGSLSGLNILQNITLNTGVTSSFYFDDYSCFMLWSNSLVPYAKKYNF